MLAIGLQRGSCCDSGGCPGSLPQRDPNVFGVPPAQTLLKKIRASVRAQQFNVESDSESFCARILEAAAGGIRTAQAHSGGRRGSSGTGQAYMKSAPLFMIKKFRFFAGLPVSLGCSCWGGIFLTDPMPGLA